MNSVTVVIPVRDGERYLGEAIDSVLRQSLPATELVVVDDGSQDGTAAVMERYRGKLTCLQQECSGAATARNRGVAYASTDLVAFLDADDLWSDDKLERQVRALAANSSLAMVFGHVEQFVSPDLAPHAQAALRTDPEPRPGYCCSAMLIRKEAWRRVGGFAPALRLGDFLDWYARACDAGLDHALLPEVVCRRRLHERNMGRTLKASRGDYARVLHAILQRRRSPARRGTDPG